MYSIVKTMEDMPEAVQSFFRQVTTVRAISFLSHLQIHLSSPLHLQRLLEALPLCIPSCLICGVLRRHFI